MKILLQALAIVVLFFMAVKAQVIIDVNPGITYQTIESWEANDYDESPCASSFPIVRDSIIYYAINDIGINRVHLTLKSGAENTTDYYTMWRNDGCPEPPDSAYYFWRHHRYTTINDNNDPNNINWDGFLFTEMDWQIENIILPMKQQLEANNESLYINLC